MDFHISIHDDGRRIDKVLRNLLKNGPNVNLYKMLRTGDIKVNGKKIKEDYRLKEKDHITIYIPKNFKPKEQDSSDLKITKLPFDIILEDENILAINKPSGLASQGGTGQKKDVMSIVKSYFKDKTDFVPQIAHRLDLETSGILVLAKTGKILRELEEILKGREIEKYYLCFVKGVPKNTQGKIDIPLERTENKDSKVIVSKTGQKAITLYEVLESDGDISLIKAQILTGRMHQIRVHMKEINHPIIGDEKYGDFEWNKNFFKRTDFKNRLYLHSFNMKFSLSNKNYNIICDPNWHL